MAYPFSDILVWLYDPKVAQKGLETLVWGATDVSVVAKLLQFQTP